MKEYFKTLGILTPSQLDMIDPYLENRILKRGDFLIKENQICNEIAFIKSGVIRSYLLTEDGKEITNCIAFDNEMISSYSSLITQKPAEENLQALVETDIEVLTKTSLAILYESDIVWQKVGRFFSEKCYIELNSRVNSFQRDSATVRYMSLIKNHPKYIKTISLDIIASYLGISTRHLTRIRKSIL